MGKHCSNNLMKRKSLNTFLDILLIVSYFFGNSTISTTTTIIALKSRWHNSPCHLKMWEPLATWTVYLGNKKKSTITTFISIRYQDKTAMKEKKFSSTSL